MIQIDISWRFLHFEQYVLPLPTPFPGRKRSIFTFRARPSACRVRTAPNGLSHVSFARDATLQIGRMTSTTAANARCSNAEELSMRHYRSEDLSADSNPHASSFYRARAVNSLGNRQSGHLARDTQTFIGNSNLDFGWIVMDRLL